MFISIIIESALITNNVSLNDLILTLVWFIYMLYITVFLKNILLKVLKQKLFLEVL